MKVSIITIVYNNREMIAEAIESVLSQDYPNLEYIVIDGLSTDGTQEVIEKYKSKISYYVSEKDNGLYDALNKGINIATGDVIGFLHSDDLFSNENSISNIVNTFEKYKTESVYADLVYVRRDKPDIVIRNWKSGNYRKSSFRFGWMPPHPTFYVKKSVYETLGLYNTNFRSAADYELMLRYLYKNEISVSYYPEILVKMRVGGKSNNTFKNRILANHEDHSAWLINGLNPPFYTRFFKPLRKLFQFCV